MPIFSIIIVFSVRTDLHALMLKFFFSHNSGVVHCNEHVTWLNRNELLNHMFSDTNNPQKKCSVRLISV